MNIRRVKFKDIEQVPSIKINTSFKQEFFGSAPSPFIGRFGYPTVNIGVLSPQFSGEMSSYDSPLQWSREKASIGEIASRRYSLVNSRSQADAKTLRGKFLEMVQEVGMARTAAEVEIRLQKKPSLSMKPEKEIMPFGPQADIQQGRITANTVVDRHVENVVADTDLKAAEGIRELYRKGLEENAVSKLLSVGTLGVHRTLVPTRWSITATDDTIGRKIILDIKDFQTGEYRAYFGGHWGNYYLMLFFPEVWSYELFETYLSQKVNPWSKSGYMYSTDYEGYEGRKTYAEETAGGYYAARLAVAEKMNSLKRQHSCLALRFITSEYNVPLGVWVCREAARKSVQTMGLSFASQELMMQYARMLIQNKFGFEVDMLLRESILLKTKRQQKKLWEYGSTAQ